MKHKVRRRILYYFAKALYLICSLLPFELVRFMGGGLGELAYLLLRKERQGAIENLTFAFGGEKDLAEVKTIARRVFRNLGITAAEIICMERLGELGIRRFVDAEGLDRLEDAFKAGRGAIVVAAHFGNWEWMAAYVALCFAPKGHLITTFARQLRIKKYDKFLSRVRKRYYIETLRRQDKDSFKRALRTLKRNGLVGVVPDQDIDSTEGTFVDFFGRPAYTPVGPVALALVSGAPLLPIFMVRKNGRFKITVEPAIELENSENKQKNLEINTAKWSKVVESYIRRYPDHWVWMHRRWKTTPERKGVVSSK